MIWINNKQIRYCIWICIEQQRFIDEFLSRIPISKRIQFAVIDSPNDWYFVKWIVFDEKNNGNRISSILFQPPHLTRTRIISWPEAWKVNQHQFYMNYLGSISLLLNLYFSIFFCMKIKLQALCNHTVRTFLRPALNTTAHWNTAL